MDLSHLLANNNYYFSIIKQDWLNSKDHFPDFLTLIPQNKQEDNEQFLDNYLKQFQKQIKRFHSLPLLNKYWKRKTLNMFQNFLQMEQVLSVHQHMTTQDIQNFKIEMMDFMREVRTFAPELSFEDIGQATRNYIVFAMFKIMHKEYSGFNKAAFGYSMLYPFTDNYIDSKSNTPKDKKIYNQLIHDKIKGLPTSPISTHHRKTCELIGAIESLYPRDNHSDIYKLLLQMLDAQELSIKQQHSDLMLSKEERLDISIYKGGISVLIDRYFVQKELTEKDILFYLGFGFFLQLADDLQDIGDDSSKGHSTLLTYDTSCPEVEKVVNKILHFLHHITKDYQPDNISFKEFVLSSSYLLILSSVIGSKKFFSQSYLDRMNKHLPVSKIYLEKLLLNKPEQMNSHMQDQYLRRLDELIQ